jgi:hypothetical protein
MPAPLHTTLTTINAFAGLSPAALDTLSATATESRFRPGTQVITKGESPGALMLLVAGRLKVTATSTDGRELTFRIVEPVEIVGEVALLDGQPRTADVVALNTSTVLLLPRAAVLAALERHPDFALGMIRLLCTRLRETSLGLESIATQRVPARLAAILLRLAAEYGRPASDGGILLPMRLSQSDLSTMIAATREAVNKQLAQWREAGVLRIKTGQIVLLRPEALRQPD